MVERRTLLQTVVHNHITQTVCRPLCERRDTVLRLLAQPDPAREEETRSRPTLAARRLVRLFAAESARQELGQFFQGVVRAVIRDERREVLRRPGQELSLVYHVWSERALRETVERLSRETWERAGRPPEPPAPPPALPRRSDQPEGGAKFRALLRGIEGSLERKERLEALRQGR